MALRIGREIAYQLVYRLSMPGQISISLENCIIAPRSMHEVFEKPLVDKDYCQRLASGITHVLMTMDIVKNT